MNEFNDDSKQYSADLIRQYLEGALNESEMHAIEKAALEDPFLADAIDGMREARKEFSNETIDSNLGKLHTQISERVAGGKVIPFTSFGGWRIVAAASILLVCSVFAYNIWWKPASKETIAVVNPTIIPPATIAPTEPNFKVSPQDSIKEEVAKNNEIKKLPSLPVISEKQDRDDRSASAVPAGKAAVDQVASSIKKTDGLKESVTTESVNADERIKDISNESEITRRKQASKEEKAAPGANTNNGLAVIKDPAGTIKGNAAGISNNISLNVFNGKIIDNNKRPVANATVQLANTNNGYLTDQNGNFRFSSTDTLVEVNVSIVGYSTQQFQLRNDVPINQLQIQPDKNGLNEEVVVTEDQKIDAEKTDLKKRFPRVLIQDAEPVNGWIEFERYIEANKRISNAAKSKSGEVVVSFRVSRNATLSDFKIEQSLSPSQDAEAVRLIKEGPAWHLLKGKRTRVMVIIRF
jgi:hypothetical protein